MTILSNGFLNITLEGASVKSLRVNRAGKDSGGLDFVKELKPEFWQETPETRIDVSGSKAKISPLEICEHRLISIEKDTHTPQRLEEGHTLAQTFRISSGTTFSSVSIKLPTWNSADSGAVLKLYKDGELISSRKAEKIPDNSWQEIVSDRPLGEGVYTIEISEPVGTIGWWSSAEEVNPLGEALEDGKPVQADRSLRINSHILVGTGALEFSLAENRLAVRALYKPTADSSYKTFPWRWKTTWTRSGYDCSPRAGVVFNRFFTDNQRYMPVEQLKRRSHGGLSFNGCRWVEMEGNRDADLRLEADDIHLHWEMEEDEMSLRFDTPVKKNGGRCETEWALVIKERKDDVPEDFPRFSCSDKKLERDLNRFWWERGFTYGSPPNRSIEFSEWMAIMRAWFEGPQRDGEIRHLLEYPITDEGYIHTYGEIVGWPLVPNRDTRHFDTNARFILACWRHYIWTGDELFLKNQIERLRRAMDYQLEVLQGKDGLIVTPSFRTGRHEDLSNNYWDILPFGHKDAYANAVFYASLEAMAQIEESVTLTSGPSPVKRERGAAPAFHSQLPRRTPYYYRRLAEKVKARYNETFWLEDKGRYAGCVDVDGKVYDYGFTFVNLEALYYGLGDKEKAERIYRWMETERTSSGRADTYSKWIFAPRATTIHNPMWGQDTPEKELKDPMSPWWTYWWKGTPFGDQCQDGGAILYTSFFDLMNRLRYKGIDNAWQRFGEIMNRYRMPDRLCGGSPLYHGEISQQENAGSVGVDYPFPESGMVPLFFLYGVIGIEPGLDGLYIKPNLPDSLTNAGVRYLHMRGWRLEIDVTRSDVVVKGTSRTNQAIRRKIPIKPGEEVFLELPEM